MSVIEVEGIVSGESQTGTAGPPFTIKPSADPSTKDYTVAAPSVTFTQKSLNNDTYVKDAQDVVVWQGTVRANDVEDLVIRSLYFQNDGTADENDVDQYSFFKKEGNVVTALETAVTPESAAGKEGDVEFPNLDEDGVSGLLVPAGEEFGIFVTADISSNPSTSPLHTIELALDLDGDTGSVPDVEDEDGDDADLTTSC
jgi:hypothetical protein